MKLWPRYSLLLLVTQLALLGQSSSSLPQLEKKGNAALASGLWELAEQHFRSALHEPKLSPEVKSRLTLRLSETLIRADRAPSALELLNQPLVFKNPESSFWRAQALVAQSRYSEAATVFSELLQEPAPPYPGESGLTLASIQLALGTPDAALATLGQVVSAANEATRLKIRLYQIEILLDLGRTEEAARQMEELGKLPTEQLTTAAFLKAHLQLRQGKFTEAQAAFQALSAQLQSPALTHSQSTAAAIGLAEAIKGQGNSILAIDSLISFLQDHPDTQPLEPIFSHIIQWLPDKPLANDPTLERLSQWISPSVLPSTGPLATGFDETGASAAWPTYGHASERTDLLVYSLLSRAIGLHKTDQVDSQAEAKRLLNRIRAEHPSHPLASHALYHLARWALDRGDVDQAFSILETLRDTSPSPFLRGQATLLEARSSYSAGDTQRAIELFDEAAATLTGKLADSTKRQSAVARLHHLEIKGISSVTQSGSVNDPQLQADLELESAFFTTPPAATKAALEAFLAQHPNHPRAAEARLAAIEATLSSPEPDVAFATTQLLALSENPPAPATLAPARIAFTRLQLADFTKDTASTIALAQALIAENPSDPAASDAALILGRTLFQSRSYNDARLVLERLAATDTDPVRAQAAWLLAANSAALGGTQQSKDSALILFDKTIQLKGNLSPIATLQKAEQLIDMKRFAEASDFLGKYTKSLPASDPTQLPAGMLLAKALYAQGASNPASLVQALAIYDELVTRVTDQPIWLNRLQYLRGLTLEQLPNDKDPAKKQQGKALQAYLSVMEISGQPLEWRYFEQCGFRALAILVESERWQAAISVAKKIASFKGPHAEDAALRASDLELKHPNW